MKDNPASSRTALEGLDALLGADVWAAWPSAEAELSWFELGVPVDVVPGFSGVVPVAVAVPVADPVGRSLELVSDAVEGSAASTLVLLGISDVECE